MLGYDVQASQHEADRAMAGGYSDFVFFLTGYVFPL